jgi:hypothetical protein
MLFIRIGCLDLLHDFSGIITVSLLLVCHAVVLEDVLSVMHPHLSTAHSDRAWNDDGTLGWGIILDLLFVIFKGTVETLGDKGGGE